jgi:putative addiction module killer protein
MAGLRDRATRSRVAARLLRLKRGLRGDWKSIGGGVYELRIDIGPGIRVYLAHDSEFVIVLLCGGDKSSQAKDIENAHAYWKDYKIRLR